jgi:hypothetical protein
MSSLKLPEEYVAQRKNKIVEYNDEFHVQPSIATQETKHNLYLGSMESFFNNTEKLRCEESNYKIDDIFNGNKWSNYIKNIKRHIDVIHFQFITEEKEENMEFELCISGNDNYIMCIKGDNHEEIEIKIKAKDTYICPLLEKGYHELEIYPEKDLMKSQKLSYVKLISNNQMYVVRTRWRPAAIHSGFKSSESPKFMSWVMEIEALNPTMSCYAPVTSPFGYYGFVLNKDGTVTKGINFSLWSFGMKGVAPPTHELSRILAIGDPKATFSHFSHEGTGVKIRNFNHVFGSNVSKKYVLALRMRIEPDYVFENGQIYTYFAYYWDEGTSEWKIYGIGQQFRKGKPMTSLFTRSFVEVPGPPNKERSGHVARSVLYRGWVQNKQTNEWTQLNNISGVQKGLTEQNRFIHDGRFVATMGGTRKKKYKKQIKQVLKLPKNNKNNNDDCPLFMKNVSQLDTPIGFPKITNAIILQSRRTKTSYLRFKISIPGKRRKCKITIFYGMTDGLTIESMWDFSFTMNKFSSIKYIRFKKPDVPWKYARLFIQDDNMQIWSEHTFTCDFQK